MKKNLTKTENSSLDVLLVHIHQFLTLVEDEDFIIYMVSKLFNDLNLNYRILKSGYHVLDTVKEMRPKVIILDVNLPDISGYTIGEAIKKEFDIPFFFFSARPVSELEERVKQTSNRNADLE